jgi:Ca2+-binding RTX toxin-like protein
MTTAVDDTICGLGGNDLLFGMAGNDVVLGGPGNDVRLGPWRSALRRSRGNRLRAPRTLCFESGTATAIASQPGHAVAAGSGARRGQRALRRRARAMRRRFRCRMTSTPAAPAAHGAANHADTTANASPGGSGGAARDSSRRPGRRWRPSGRAGRRGRRRAGDRGRGGTGRGSRAWSDPRRRYGGVSPVARSVLFTMSLSSPWVFGRCMSGERRANTGRTSVRTLGAVAGSAGRCRPSGVMAGLPRPRTTVGAGA